MLSGRDKDQPEAKIDVKKVLSLCSMSARYSRAEHEIQMEEDDVTVAG